MGLDFPNPLGLAAGLDKDARCSKAFAAMGFGFVELGTVTPRPQPGNPKKRLFRLVSRQAIINRMGFNSAGLDVFLHNLRRRPRDIVVGVNLGKNAATPLEQALDDYLEGLRAVYAHADYITINISSPNTRDLRTLQEGGQLDTLLAGLKHGQGRLASETGRRVPLALKVAPDLADAQIDYIAEAVLKHAIEAVIATNTTVSRPGLEEVALATESGGLSGTPLKQLSTAVIARLYRSLRGKVPIVGVGGIASAEDAWDKLVAGADLLQLYSSLIFQGPAVVARILRGLEDKVRQSGESTLTAAVQRAREYS
jgi:dihydroorotate dehydrogenase